MNVLTRLCVANKVRGRPWYRFGKEVCSTVHPRSSCSASFLFVAADSIAFSIALGWHSRTKASKDGSTNGASRTQRSFATGWSTVLCMLVCSTWWRHVNLDRLLLDFRIKHWGLVGCGSWARETIVFEFFKLLYKLYVIKVLKDSIFEWTSMCACDQKHVQTTLKQPDVTRRQEGK